MDFNAVYTVWWREWKRFMRDRVRIIGNLAMPLIWLGIMGVGLGSTLGAEFSTGPGNVDYLYFILPGIIGMNLLFASIFSGVSVIYDKQFGFLREMLVAPISRSAIVLGKTLGGATVSMISGLLILIIGIALGILPLNALTLSGIVLTLAFMALISTSFVSLGLALAAKMDSMEGFQLVMSFLVMPLFLLSGVFFPLNGVPEWLKALAFIDPLMYGIDGMRGVLMGISLVPIGVSLLILLAFNVAMILVTTRLFEKI